jgi:hypothetical protein
VEAEQRCGEQDEGLRAEGVTEHEQALAYHCMGAV